MSVDWRDVVETARGRSSSGDEENYTEEVPTVEVAERKARDGEVPRGAGAVIEAAEEGGWHHVEMYSRGAWRTRDGWAVSDFLSVRVWDNPTGRYGWALYRDGKSVHTWLYDPADPGRWRSMKVTELKALLREGEEA